MHLEDYHGERSEEDVQRPLSAGLDQDDFIDNSLHLATMAVTATTIDDCWITSQTNTGDLSSPLEPSNPDLREYLDWDQVSTVFQYPISQYHSWTSKSPESTCSEATTPTWSNAVTIDHNEDMSDCSNQRLPSVGSAFSFSRTFSNTMYPEYGVDTQDYQNDQDYQNQEDMVSLLMTIQNDNIQEELHTVQTLMDDEFDLSLIRGDPTSLLNGIVDSPSSPSSVTCLDDDLHTFQNFNGSYYAIGHLVSSQQPSTINLDGEIGKTETLGNQIILPRNEGLLLSDRRVVSSSRRAVESEKRGKCHRCYL